jgi:hypothetical protein
MGLEIIDFEQCHRIRDSWPFADRAHHAGRRRAD